jgi:acylphosphatase/uncharacterized protein YoxC
MKVRATFTVTGKVQDVGLRNKARREAISLGLVGQAENLENGSMKVVCEGPRAAVLELRQRLTAPNGVSRVRLGRIRYNNARGSFRGFRKVPDKNPAQATSRKLDEGVRHLGKINLKLGRIETGISGLNSGIKSVKSGINGVKSGIQGVKSGIQGLKSGINGLRSDNRSIKSGINGVRSGVRGLKSGVKQVHTGIKGVNSGIKGVHSGIRAMDSHMGGHFRRLDRKYDRFGDTMAQVARDIHEMAGDLRKAVAVRER